MGRIAGEPALKLIDDQETDHGQHIVVPTHLIPRATTAPPAVPSHGVESWGRLSDTER
ncbi:hypothetical protein ACWD5V_31695 [Streptomyces sp. NPDC002523]